MRGQLAESSVPDLCRGLSDAHSTGALEIDGDGGVARIFFRSGFVYWAMSPAPRAQLGSRLVNAGFISGVQLDDALDRQRASEERTKLGALLVEEGLVTQDVIRVFVQEQILDALFDVMRWDSGAYSFHTGDAVADRLPVDIPVAELMVAVARRQSEWDQVQRVIPDLDSVVDHVTGKGGMSTSLEPDEFAVLASIDGTRSIRDLAADLGYSEFEAARIVYGLTLLGVVEVIVDEYDDGLDDLAAAAGLALRPKAPPTPDPPPLEVELEADPDPVAEPEPVEPTAEPVVAAEAATFEAPAPEVAPDGLDVGAALEAALAGEPAPTEPTEPAVADDGSGPAPWVAPAPAVSDPETPDPVESTPSVAAVEPQPPEPGDVETPEPAAPTPAAAEDAPTESPVDDLEDDLEDLLAAVADVADVAEEPPPVPAAAPAAGADEEPRSAAQVSELLRELSRLTLDEEPPEDPDADAPAPRRPSKPAAEPDDDGGKKRRLFGWGG